MNTPTNTPALEWRWVRKPEVVARTGLSFATIWRMSREGHFPKFYAVGPRACAVRSDELHQWMVSRPVSEIPSPKRRHNVEAVAAG